MKLIISLILVGLVALAGLFWAFPIYNVWVAEMTGKAELSNAEYSKQVAVQTAKAKQESAQYEADAEVIRAGGVAKANHIIGESLKGNDAYLHYLWINQMETNQNAVYYVPTETSMPLMLKGAK